MQRYSAAPVEAGSGEDGDDGIRGGDGRVGTALLQLVVHVPENGAGAEKNLIDGLETIKFIAKEWRFQK